MRFLYYILMTALLALCPFRAAAAPTHIAARLVAETARPAPGSTITIALAMVPAPGWHGYWQNPGDAGVETRIGWTLPKGVTAGAPAYPVPQRLLIAGLMNYVYEGPYAHLITLRIPAGLVSGTPLPIRAAVDWLACTDKICVPERGALALDLIVGDGGIAQPDRARFDRWRAALPKPLARPAHFTQANGRLGIAFPLPATMTLRDPYFYPLGTDTVDYAAPQRFSRVGDNVVLEVKARDGANPERIEGVLAIGPDNGLTIAATPGAVPKGGASIEAVADVAAPDIGFVTIALAFGSALLGGLLLNIMPCVFPILSLKALTLVRGGESDRQARREALAYTAGVILVCLALGGALLGLRAGGAAVGWAFQLQDPRIILLLLLLVTAIALNLAGLFELPMLGGGSALAGEGGATGAFWTGALAAFVATPCTGPFMAAALGAALILPWPAALTIFFGLGAGLALPFLLLGFVPALRRRLPRPGGWMITMRRILALPMFVTAIGLAWILGRQAGVNAMTLGLVAVLIFAVGLWWIGLRQARGARLGAWPLLFAVIPGIALPFLPIYVGTTIAASAERDHEAFNEARLAALRGQGRPIFLYFTADWCLTCKVNERAAIERAEVRDAFRKAGVVTMVGDWTRGDPTIGRFLATHGRSGVPLYLYFPGGGSEPIALPQILTPSLLTGLIKSTR